MLQIRGRFRDVPLSGLDCVAHDRATCLRKHARWVLRAMSTLAPETGNGPEVVGTKALI